MRSVKRPQNWEKPYLPEHQHAEGSPKPLARWQRVHMLSSPGISAQAFPAAAVGWFPGALNHPARETGCHHVCPLGEDRVTE